MSDNEADNVDSSWFATAQPWEPPTTAHVEWEKVILRPDMKLCLKGEDHCTTVAEVLARPPPPVGWDRVTIVVALLAFFTITGWRALR